MNDVVSSNEMYYLDTIPVKYFYYKSNIYDIYFVKYFNSILPSELVDRILNNLCKDIMICYHDNNILYINPTDNKIINKLSFDGSKLNFDNKFNVTKDGLMLYSYCYQETNTFSLHNDIDNDYVIDHEYLIEDITTLRHGYNKTKLSPYCNYLTFCSSGIGYYTHTDISMAYLLGDAFPEGTLPGSVAYRNEDDMNIIAIIDTNTEELLTEIKFKNDSHINNILNMCFSPDEEYIMVITQYDNKNPNLWIFSIKGELINKFSFECLHNNTNQNNISWGANNIIAIQTENTTDTLINFIKLSYDYKQAT